MATSSEYLSAFEAERLVQSLVKLDLEDVGSTKWMIQHEAIERLNIQAHRNVQNNSEEYITEAFMRTLVHDLILIQTWKQQVYPLVKKELISDDSMTAYFLNYHEATVINLLELLFFNKDAVIAVGDWIHDLNEMISQKINYLITLKHPEASDPKKLLEMTEMERFEETLFDLDFNVAISCISLFRYITDVITDLPIGIMRQVLHSMDFVVVLVHLLEAGPWIRNKKEKLERFESGKWSTIDPDELQRVGKIEGQIWLGLMNLLLEPECRKSYGYDEHNHQIVLRLKNYISEHTVDQLPPLVDLQRYLEELVMLIPAKTREPPSGIELVSEVKDNILKTSPQAASRKTGKDV
ncbi:hypothetical protein EDD86DRAFT_245594 [Gorgonomyces haynaldii]|nr:hypothetical protein EDD86DRAFT_245594 [Gorgonomyces haynaldii]